MKGNKNNVVSWGLFFFYLIVGQTIAQQNPWQLVDDALAKGIKTKGYPGAVALVGDETGYLYFRAIGNFTYGKGLALNGNTNPPMAEDTKFDLASVTKVTGATSAIAQFYQRGELDLNTKITSFLGEEFAVNGKGPISVLNCLLHNAGYPPDPDPNYWDVSFGCPETYKEYPAENFSCQQKIFNSLLNQTLENPVGVIYVYSDLSFITLQYVVGYLARTLGYVSPADIIPGCDQGGLAGDVCYFEAYVRMYVFQPLGMHQTGFLPPQYQWSQCAPCENDSIADNYQNIQLQGQVSDGNAYALGGIAGHAGLFSTAADLFILAHRIMFASTYSDNLFINQTTADYFTTEYNHTQSCRALGWSTNDPDVVDEGWDLSCGNFSSVTWTHIGYAGTQICGDPTRNIITIFLTNRVYPFSFYDEMHRYRQNFNNAVLQVLYPDGHYYGSDSTLTPTPTPGGDDNDRIYSRDELRAFGTAHLPPHIRFVKPN